MISTFRKLLLFPLKLSSLFVKFSFFSIKHIVSEVRRTKSFHPIQAYFRDFKSAMQNFLLNLSSESEKEPLFLAEGGYCSSKREALLDKLQNHAEGLLSLLNRKSQNLYSIVISIDDYRERELYSFFTRLFQIANSYAEVIIGTESKYYHQIAKIIGSIPDLKCKWRLLRQDYPNSVSSVNELTSHAKGNYLLFIEPYSFLRPDILYRFEQTIQLYDKDLILTCNVMILDQKDSAIDNSELSRLDTIEFPYFFLNDIHPCLFISKALWDSLKGFRVDREPAHYYDLILRANAQGHSLIKLPFYFYGSRSHHTGKVDSVARQKKAVEALQEYANQLGLKWTALPGYKLSHCYSIPQGERKPKVHVVVPYKDQKHLTLAAAKSIIAQQSVEVALTMVDNRSEDKSIAEELNHLGAEVLRIDEPFNFSRLNNLAVAQSTIGAGFDLVVFVNNDVELAEDALYQMAIWVDEPRIGIVGGRLNFPDGTLQHGGVDFDLKGGSFFVQWLLTDYKRDFANASIGCLMRSCPSVSGACSMMKKELFKKIGGFDEVWFPISFSDTSLSDKLTSIGLLSLYTPFSYGIHHESATRKVLIEDFEASQWLRSEYFKLKPFSNKEVRSS